jgi:DNA-binding NarL/FixJ family response regulator
MLVRETHAALAPLIGGVLARFDDPSPRDLTPRLRQVLDCLLEGDGDKQIAARLQLSVHTVNEYTKKIYGHFGVRGRTELLARWICRGWGAQSLKE